MPVLFISIKRASEQLDLPPPLEVERSAPRLTRDLGPISRSAARVAERGHLVQRPLSHPYSPQAQLEAQLRY